MPIETMARGKRARRRLVRKSYPAKKPKNPLLGRPYGYTGSRSSPTSRRRTRNVYGNVVDALRPHLPGLKGTTPRLKFRRHRMPEGVPASTSDRDEIQVGEEIEAALSMLSPEQRRKVKHILAHELAHTQQKGFTRTDKSKGGWTRASGKDPRTLEAGAEAFARNMTRRYFGGKRVSNAYQDEVKALRESRKPRYIRKRQFKNR